MKTEDEPITNDEWLIRLVWGDRVTDRTPIIRPSSFEPRDDEMTGISFFRKACLKQSTDALIAIAEGKRDRYALVLVSVSVSLIQQLDCTVLPNRIAQVFGHVLVPEINSEVYRTEKQRLETLFLQLALEASDHIIRRPLV